MSRERERFEEEDEVGKRIKREVDAAKAKSMVASNNNCYDNNNNHHQIQLAAGRRQMVGPPPPGTTLNTITPCAACKLLRRRCAEECPFSPYFSPHEPQKFAAVHKVFGASNVSKLLMEVPDNQRADAANSLVYEANVRLRDPVYGCMGAISALQQQVQTLQAELNAVRSEILKYKYREAANTLISATNNNATNHPHHHPNNSLVTSVAAAVIAASLPQVQQQQQQHQQPQHQQQQATPPPPPATPPHQPAASVSVVTSSPAGAASLYTPQTPHHDSTTETWNKQMGSSQSSKAFLQSFEESMKMIV